jgi:hypothetical protein
MTALLKPVPSPLKLDIGCGKNKREGFLGVDLYQFDGVDVVLNVVAGKWDPYDDAPRKFEPWPWETSSVDEAHSSHFVEHLTPVERCHFFNELWRVLKPGAQATIITPHWSNARAYGDPTHQWPAISEWFYLYLNRDWRSANAPHSDAENWAPGYKCHFEGGCVTTVNPQHPELMGKNPEAQNYATRNFINVNVDAYATLTAKK